MPATLKMLWTYNRAGRRTSYEVSHSADGCSYELKRHLDNGGEECETFPTLARLNERMQQLEKQLLADGWSLAGALRR